MDLHPSKHKLTLGRSTRYTKRHIRWIQTTRKDIRQSVHAYYDVRGRQDVKKTHIHGLFRFQRRIWGHGSQNTLPNNERPRIPRMLHQHMRATLQSVRHLVHDTTRWYPHHTHPSRHIVRRHPISLPIRDIHEATTSLALHRKHKIYTHIPATNTHMYIHYIWWPRLHKWHQHHNKDPREPINPNKETTPLQ